MTDRNERLFWIFGVVSMVYAVGLTACRRNGSLAGDRCKTTEDCKSPLVCSTKADPKAAEGICVYPGALPQDAGTEDAALAQDSEVSVDAGTGDAGAAADGSPHDALLDGGLQDGSLQDAAISTDASMDAAPATDGGG